VTFEGADAAFAGTVLIQALAEVGVPADPDLGWIAGAPVPGTLGLGRIQVSPSVGTLRNGSVSVSIDTIALPAGDYDGSLQIDAPDLNDSSQTIPVHVTVKPVHVVIRPDTATLNVGDAVVLTAEPQDESGTPIPGATFQWSSADPSVAAVDAAGIVTAVASGNTGITATDSLFGKRATVTVSVKPSCRPQLVDLGELSLCGNWTLSWVSGEDGQGLFIRENGTLTPWKEIQPGDNDLNHIHSLSLGNQLGSLPFL
jgi:hypothetical protein